MLSGTQFLEGLSPVGTGVAAQLARKNADRVCEIVLVVAATQRTVVFPSTEVNRIGGEKIERKVYGRISDENMAKTLG